MLIYEAVAERGPAINIRDLSTLNKQQSHAYVLHELISNASDFRATSRSTEQYK